MIESLKHVSPGQVISAQLINTLIDEVTRLSKMSAASPLVMSQGPGGPSLALGIDVNPFDIRIDSFYSAKGVYKAYVLSPSLGSSLDSLDTATDIKLGDSDADQPDDEEIVVWNAPERDSVGDVSGADVNHIIPIDAIIPIAGGGVFLGPVTISGGADDGKKMRLLLINYNPRPPKLAILALLPGQIGTFGGVLGGTDEEGPGGEQNPLGFGPSISGLTVGTGGYRAVVLFDPSYAPIDPFADDDDPTPDDPETNYSYNATYYNLDENSIESELLNPSDPGNITQSSGKWLSDNVDPTFGASGATANSTVVGLRIGIDSSGRGIYVGVGGRASLAYQTLTDSPLGSYWVRGGVGRATAKILDAFGVEQTSVGCAGVQMTCTNSKTGEVFNLRFDASGKLHRMTLVSTNSSDVAYSAGNPPP